MSHTLPPGLEEKGTLSLYSSFGEENAWLPFNKIKHYTNAFIVQENKILLGYKKRGFGLGKYNGFGGKVELGETSLQAAARELEEESGVKADLEHAGSFLFFNEGAEFAFQIEIYRAEKYVGEITETDEMRPEWFSVNSAGGSGDNSSESLKGEYPNIPFEKMWGTDYVWLPLLIAKQKFVGRADFVQDGDDMKPYKWWYGLTHPAGKQ